MYALVISSTAGLWPYVVGDIVRLVDLDPPRLLVTGRVQQGLSTFGEHRIEAEIAEALTGAAAAQEIAVLDYSVASQRGETGGHRLFLIEPAVPANADGSDRLATARRGFRENQHTTHYLWRAVDHEGEVLESFANKRRDRKSALKC